MSGFFLNICFFRMLCVISVLLFSNFNLIAAKKSDRLTRKADKAAQSFVEQASKEFVYTFKYDSLQIDSGQKEITLYMNPVFSYIPFRLESVQRYKKDFKEELGRRFRNYSIRMESMGQEISDLIPNFYRNGSVVLDSNRLNKNSEVAHPLVRRVNTGNDTKLGLENKHIALWHSHGWYYENTLDRWEWQRARVYTTVEDLWTMEFVVPYIAPMLEKAGANVLFPRERDVQRNEVIVDADWSSEGSEYLVSDSVWELNSQAGFANKYPFYIEGENPFELGSSYQTEAGTDVSARVQYIPCFPKKGEYAVSVSYSDDEDNVNDAHYTVNHAGGKTEFLVNQSMGGKTWIYLGTFLFDKGKNPEKGMVELTNESKEPGKWISADAIRFGGGMGNIARGNPEELDELKKQRAELGFKLDSCVWQKYTSNRPRYQEAARYYLQYAGMPDSLVYSINKDYKADYSNRGKDAAKFQKREIGKTDYKDDYMSRGEWVDYLLGAPAGPTKNVDAKGLGIPIDMALAFHTDAGFTPNDSIIGSLAIYSTTRDEDSFPNGQSKWASRDLTDIVQTQVVEDIRKKYEPKWTRRGMWNKQYSEAYRPKVPTMLSELLSHHNFADMYQGMDPKFKFDISRAYYKGILKFLSSQDGRDYVVQPLPVDHFQIKETENGIVLSWKPVIDQLESTAMPEFYKVYTRIEEEGFNEGTIVTNSEYKISNCQPGVIYSFKVTALNKGGESFDSEILACCKSENGKKPVLIVNGFDRISAPQGFDDGKLAGFISSEDEGVAYKRNIACVGDQYDFDRKSKWLDDDASGHGSSYADQEERIIPGNSFDYPFVHGQAIRDNGFGFVSMSDEAFEELNWEAKDYSVLDLIFGEEKTTKRIYGKENKDFTIYTPEMREAIRKYISCENANLILTGAYVGTDLELCGDSLAKSFAENELHFQFRTNHASKLGKVSHTNEVRNNFTGEYQFETEYSADIYKVEAPDAIEPKGDGAKVLLRYSGNNKSAGVVYDGNYQSVILGFPFETLETKEHRNKLMKQMLQFFNQ
ncbi:fibronectin type III domain-containing protein [Labilibaculum manganireducens]|uniref:golvesin C-terminal-like domain-containing protein n=1 Tax=Labilibaculum manganireducens TaxID=1940525 RepID=UPI0029F561C9|nr:fibronectin type III domain-containing protein [Labilibaculum manganireducens]